MQILLTQEEYEKLQVDKDLDIDRAEKSLALLAARTIILQTAGKKCWQEDGTQEIGYCDDCPCAAVNAPRGTYRIYKHICTLDQEYSK